MKFSRIPLIFNLLAALFLAPPAQIFAQTADLYETKIYLDPNASEFIQTVAADVAEQLAKSTGKKFQIQSTTNQTAPGIYLTRQRPTSGNQLEINQLDKVSSEAFYLKADRQQVRMFSRSDNGLSYAAYFWLEKLGFRWLLPGEAWEIQPPLHSLQTVFEKTVVPDFRVRQFTGTGGLIALEAEEDMDETEGRANAWTLWKQRNRFGEEYELGGHSGVGFNTHNKKELEAHPEYLAFVKGERGPWKRNAKWCVSNPGLVELYIADRIKEFENKTRKTGIEPYAVSVEPADGGGYCECEPCAKIGTTSDCVFYLANQVARKLREKHPAAFVNLYAYYEHAAVPKIALEPNVYVFLAPYAFQQISSPEAFIRDWAAKMPRLGIRDYWNITGWAQDLPKMDFVKTFPERIRYWKANHVDAVKAQSTFSKGAVGLALYEAAHLLWDADADDAALRAEFYRLAFGPAAAPMQRMFERWAADFKGLNELPYAYADLAEATRLAGTDKPILLRINEFKAYVHFLRLFSEYQILDKTAAAARAEKVGEILPYIWGIHPMNLLHTDRLHGWLVNRNEKETNPDLAEKWGMAHGKFRGKKFEVGNISARQIEQLFEAGRQKYPPLFELPKAKTEPAPPRKRDADAPPAEPILTVKSSGKTAEFTLVRGQKLTVWPGPDGTFELDATQKSPEKDGQTALATLFDGQRKIVCEQNLLDKPRLRCPGLRPGEPYNLELKVKKSQLVCRVADRSAVAFVAPLKIFRLPERLYFFVPAGTTEVLVEVGKKANPSFFDPLGKPVKLEAVRDKTVRLVVPSRGANAWWSVTCETGDLRLLNVLEALHLFPNLVR